VPPKIKKTEQVPMDSEVLTEFKTICRVMEENWKWKLRAMIKEFISDHRGKVNRILENVFPDVEQGERSVDGEAVLDKIIGYWFRSKAKNIGDILSDIVNDYSMTKKEEMSLKRIVAQYGVGISKKGELYIAINHPVLTKMTGEKAYHVKIKADCPEYRSTKMANIGGESKRCLVLETRWV
jgi:hypothetical protein